MDRRRKDKNYSAVNNNKHYPNLTLFYFLSECNFYMLCILIFPGGGEIFRTCPDRPWGPPSLLYNGYRAFPGGRKRPGRDADPSPPCSAEV
jgi:hypothetical protein